MSRSTIAGIQHFLLIFGMPGEVYVFRDLIIVWKHSPKAFAVFLLIGENHVGKKLGVMPFLLQ